MAANYVHSPSPTPDIRIDPLIETIARLWRDLPFVLGEERWLAVKATLAAYLTRYDGAPDAERKHRVVVELEDWLDEETPTLRAWLDEQMAAEAQIKGGLMGGRGVYELMMADIRGRVFESAMAVDAQPAPVTRYTDIQLPARVQVGQRFAVIVGLSMAPSPDSAHALPIIALAGQMVQVVLAPSPGLEMLSARALRLLVHAERDSHPAVFYLRATAEGRHDLGIEFWIEGQLVASSRHSITALDQAVVEIPARPASQPIEAGLARAAHPDLVLRITTRDNQLRYDLHFADVRFLSVPGERLRSDPETFRYELIRRMERLAGQARERGDPALLQRALEREGRNLYKELFSADMRREYRRFWREVRTMQIISDEPWLPWELIKPYDDDGELLDHDFLCMQFDLARWCDPAPAPAPIIRLQSLAVVAPTDSGLAAAQQEREALRSLALAQGLTDLTPALPTRQAVLEELLEGNVPIDLWHFACHGDFDGRRPADAPLELQNRERLTPADLNGPAQTRLKRDRPLVVFNACRVGQSGLALTGMGGWAKVLVQDCDVGAFLAPMWEVTDSLSLRFAQAFYQATREAPGRTLAEAVSAARHALRRQAPQDPTWLAYALYAHPNARLAWDGSRG
jgi:hypothetical protein